MSTDELTHLFALTFPQYPHFSPYPAPRLSQITSTRSRLPTSTLFIDHLLHTICHVPRTNPPLYPPRNLPSLFNTLHTSIPDPLKRHALLYYLLLDLEHVHPTIQPPPCATFAARVLLPDAWQMLITALWRLDNLILSPAPPQHPKPILGLLCNPSVTVPLPSKVIQTLSQHGTPDLVVGFISATQPPLTDPADVDTYFTSLLSLNVVSAFEFYRTTPEEGGTKKELFKKLIETAVETGGEMAEEVVDLPFDEEERGWFEEVLGKGGDERRREMLSVWWLHVGKFEDAVGVMGKMEEVGEGGVSWGVVEEGVRKGLGGRLEIEA